MLANQEGALFTLMDAITFVVLIALALRIAHVHAQGGSTADYIVVGGGTAGCALAARLCEYLPNATVTLLERGKPRSDKQELQVRCSSLLVLPALQPRLVHKCAGVVHTRIVMHSCW